MRQPSGNLFAKVTLLPAVNNRLELSHNYGHGNPEFPGDRTPYEAYALSSNGSQGPGTVNATRLTWTMARGSRLSNELDLAYLRVREEERCLSSSPLFRGRGPAPTKASWWREHGFSCTVNFANQDVWELTDNLSWLPGPISSRSAPTHELIRTRRLPRIQPLGQWNFASLDSLEAGLPFSTSGASRTRSSRRARQADLRLQQVGLLPAGPVGAEPGSHPHGRPPDRRAVPPHEPAAESATSVGARIDNTLTPSGNALWSPRVGFNYDVGGRGTIPAGRGGPVLRTAGIPLVQLGLRDTGLDAPSLLRSPDVPAFTLDPDSQPTQLREWAIPVLFEVNYFNPSFRFPRNLRLSLGTDLGCRGEWSAQWTCYTSAG